MIRYLLTTILTLLMTCVVEAAEPLRGKDGPALPSVYAQPWTEGAVYGHDSQYPFLIITKDTVKSLPRFSDEDFYNYSTGVLFQVNKTDVRPDDPFILNYQRNIVPLVNEKHLQLRKLFVRGAASPEGSYENNRRLGQARTSALLAELQRSLQYQYLNVEKEISSVTEDYGYLCILMKQAGDADYKRVKAVYDECQGDEVCCKTRLMALDGGALWNRLLKQYFPKLRAARVILWFSEPDEEHAPVVITRVDTIIYDAPVHITRVDTICDTTYLRRTIIIEDENIRPCCDDDCANWTANDSILRHPVLALKSNLLFDLATFVNAEVEVPIARRWSVLAEVTWPWWLQKSHYNWCNEMGALSLEGRLWFRPWERHSDYKDWKQSRRAPLQGWFMGWYAHAGYYDLQDFKFTGKQYHGRQGEFLGGGLTFGYSSRLSNHWRMEFSLGLGAVYNQYRKYHLHAGDEDHIEHPLWNAGEQHIYRDTPEGEDLHKWWIGPTKLKVSLSYLIYKRCKGPKGSVKQQKGGRR